MLKKVWEKIVEKNIGLINVLKIENIIYFVKGPINVTKNVSYFDIGHDKFYNLEPRDEGSRKKHKSF